MKYFKRRLCVRVYGLWKKKRAENEKIMHSFQRIAHSKYDAHTEICGVLDMRGTLYDLHSVCNASHVYIHL